MTFAARVTLGALVLAFALPAAARAASAPLHPAVLVVATFEFGDPRARGSRGEAGAWVLRDGLTQAVDVPGLALPAFCDPAGAECLIVTGIGKANAAASTMVIGTSPAFDLRHTYVVLAGIAGTSPWQSSVGSVAWARWIVDSGVSNEIDPREPHAPAGFARSRFGCNGVAWCNTRWHTGTEVFPIDPALQRWALGVSRRATLADAAPVRRYRAKYAGTTFGARPPAIDSCDTVADDTYWAGAITARFASWWVKRWTNGAGRYCMTSMEDSGFMTAVTRLVAMHQLAPRHTLDLRGASDYDEQYPGSTAQAALASVDQTGGFELALENVYRAGEPVVRALRAGATVAFALPKPLTFFQAPPVTALTKADARRLIDVPVAGGPGLRLTKTGAPDRDISTCRQFDAAMRDGFDVTTSVDIIAEGFFVRACGLLDAVLRARPPRRDTIAGVRLRDLDVISAAALPLAPWESANPTPAERARRERTTLAAFARANHCRVTMATAGEVRLQCDDVLYALEELLRADFDGSGDTEILVSPYMRSGTLAVNDPDVILARRAPHGLLVPLP
jgi:purine nucleoside permease